MGPADSVTLLGSYPDDWSKVDVFYRSNILHYPKVTLPHVSSAAGIRNGFTSALSFQGMFRISEGISRFPGVFLANITSHARRIKSIIMKSCVDRKAFVHQPFLLQAPNMPIG